MVLNSRDETNLIGSYNVIIKSSITWRKDTTSDLKEVVTLDNNFSGSNHSKILKTVE